MYKLSIVVPIYMVENYIERCAISLFQQTLSDVEFIFIDDRSPDKSVDVLKQVISNFTSLQDSIRIVEHPNNRGSAAARITGIKQARGEYIAFCDSDDWVDSNLYEQMYEVAKRNDADLVYCNFEMEYLSKTKVADLPKKQNVDDYIRFMMMGAIPFYSWIRLYRKNILQERVDELYQLGINMWEDVLMNMRLSFCLKQIAFCPVAGYHYNQCNLNSYTFVRSEQSQRNILEVVRLVSLVVEKWQIFMFPLSCFRLNALYSISSHSSIEDLKKMNWPYSVEDNRCIWKHPIMSVDNKLFLTLLSFRLYKTAYIYMRIKRKIKNIILFK